MDEDTPPPRIGDPSLMGTKGDESRQFRGSEVGTEAGDTEVLVGISPATYSEIERLARATGVGARRMLDRLIEHGVNSWHEARQAGRLTSLW